MHNLRVAVHGGPIRYVPDIIPAKAIQASLCPDDVPSPPAPLPEGEGSARLIWKMHNLSLGERSKSTCRFRVRAR